MRYLVLVFLCNNLICELFAWASLLKSPDKLHKWPPFSPDSQYNLQLVCVSWLQRSPLAIYLTAMDDVHEGNLAESVINTLQRSSPWFHPQWLYQHFVKSTCKFPKKRKFKHHIWQLTTSFYESTLCQEHLQVPKKVLARGWTFNAMNRCKREDNSQDLEKRF